MLHVRLTELHAAHLNLPCYLPTNKYGVLMRPLLYHRRPYVVHRLCNLTMCPTAIPIASSDSLSPTAVIGGACRQSPECGNTVTRSLALSTSNWALERTRCLWFAATGPLRAFWMCCVCWVGLTRWPDLSIVTQKPQRIGPLAAKCCRGVRIAGAGVRMQLMPKRLKVPATQHSVFPDLHLRLVMKLEAIGHHIWKSEKRSPLHCIYGFAYGLLSQLSLIHIWRCRRSTLCRSRWSPYH